MAQLVHVNNYDLPIKVYKGQRVITFEDMDAAHERPAGTAKRNFNKNAKRFTLDKHFFRLIDEDLKQLKQSTNFVPSNTKEIVLITEKGYLLLVKSFNDDLAWQVQELLIDNYFRAKEFLKIQHSDPQWQEVRQNSKTVRLQETDEIKRYVEYCEEHGSKNAVRYYTTFSRLVNNAVGIMTGQRDFAAYETLQLVSFLENIVRRTVLEEIQKETEYHKIYHICKEKVTGVMSYTYLPDQRLLSG